MLAAALGAVVGAAICGAVVSVYMLLESIPVEPWVLAVTMTACGVGGLAGATLGALRDRRGLLGAFLAGAFIGGTLPPAVVLGLWALAPHRSGLAGERWWYIYLGSLAASPVGALVVGGLAVYVTWHLRRDDVAEQ
jgi:hypothetical protein